MNRRTSLLSLISTSVVVALAALMPLQSHAGEKGGRMEGTWLATFTFSDDSQSLGLLTFSGSSDDEGTLIVSASDSLTFPFPCLTEQGVWAKAKRSPGFVASDTGFCFDASNENAFVGIVKARYFITLNNNGEGFGGHGNLAITKTTGEVAYADTFQVSAVRQHPEAP